MPDKKIDILPEVQEFLVRKHGLYIDGNQITSHGASRLPVCNPATGEVIATVANASVADVDLAVQSSHACFVSGRWSGLLPAERERILLKFADLLESRQEEFAQLETLEQGKSITMARIIEVGSAVQWMRYAAGLATKITGKTMDVSIPRASGSHYAASTRREPVGVVAGIVPFNFPLMIGTWKVVPALAAGCTIVIKPSETTPLTMLRLAELATEAGLPAGAFNVVTGSGAIAGEALTTHRAVSKISFTGSTPTGKAIARKAIDTLKHVSLELGGKNPAIVLKDANLDDVVPSLVAAAFLNQGQVCASCSRIYVEEPIFDALVARLEQAICSMSIGPGLDESMQINPLVSSAQRDKVQTFIENARAKGAKLIEGASAPDGNGYYVRPTLVINPDDALALTRQEVFGPVLSITKVADSNEALMRANDTDMGLTASLWTNNLQSALNITRKMQAGTVWVNSHVMIDPNMPFGGFKQSGTGRDFGVDWLDAYTEIKSVCICH